MTDEERSVLTEVHSLMNAAAKSAPQLLTEAELIASGWPERIKPIAQEALLLILGRGRFSEDVEESEPSSPVPHP